MADLRTVLAAVLGVALGLLFLAYPGGVVRVQTAGRLPPGRHGEYGADGAVSSRWLWVVRLLGAAFLLGGVYVGATGLGL